MKITPHTPELIPPRSGDIETILDQIEERRRRRRKRLIGGTSLTVIVAAILTCVTILIPRSSQTTTSASVADVVRMNGIDYGNSDTYRLPRSLLGHRIGTIQRQLHINDTGPNPPGQLATNDTVSTTWPKGTAIYSVKGYRSTFRLAVVTSKVVQLYEVDWNPAARHGADLLDIDGKVRRIDISTDRDSVLGHIQDPRQISTLIAQILTAPVDQSAKTDGRMLFLRFDLHDGTTVVRAMFGTPILERGILIPNSFYRTILAATKR